MEMTNREMIGHLNQLAIINEKLGGELNYKISRNKEKLTKEYEQFDKARQEAKKDYCELDEDGICAIPDIPTAIKVPPVISQVPS